MVDEATSDGRSPSGTGSGLRPRGLPLIESPPTESTSTRRDLIGDQRTAAEPVTGSIRGTGAGRSSSLTANMSAAEVGLAPAPAKSG